MFLKDYACIIFDNTPICLRYGPSVRTLVLNMNSDLFCLYYHFRLISYTLTVCPYVRYIFHKLMVFIIAQADYPWHIILILW